MWNCAIYRALVWCCLITLCMVRFLIINKEKNVRFKNESLSILQGLIAPPDNLGGLIGSVPVLSILFLLLTRILTLTTPTYHKYW